MQRMDLPRQALAVTLAALAGYVDACGFLAANRYFVSFMSGNTTRLGVDLMTVPDLAWIPAFLIAAFVVGVVCGALVAHKATTHHKPWVLLLVTLALGAAAALHDRPALFATLALLAFAMGALNNVFQREGTVSVGLTYMTGALVKLGQGLAARLVGREGRGWSAWLLLWLGLSMGAALGAWAWITIPQWALWIGSGGAALLATLARHLPQAHPDRQER